MPQSAEQANRDYFRRAYRSGVHGWGTATPSPHALAFMKRLAETVPGGALLDLGCGEGRHAIAAARLGFRVTGVDFEPLALRRARRCARSAGVAGLRFRRGDARDLPFPEAAFDVVLDYGCLHHQRKADWPAYLAGVVRVLTPGGFLVLSVFSPRFHLFRHSARHWHIAGGAYRRCFTRADLLNLFGGKFAVLDLIEDKGAPSGFWHALMQRRHPAAEGRTHGD